MKLLDTNVIVYAVGRPHLYKSVCSQLLKDAAEKVGRFNINTELLQEILYLYTAKGERALGISTCNDLLRILPDPFPISRDEIEAANELMVRYPNLLPRDAVHAATVKTNSLEGIISADKDFDSVGEILRFDPVALYPEEG